MSSDGGARPGGPAAVDEDPVVRQYRYLLRSAPADALEAAHAEALAGPASGVRAAVLAAVQEAFVAGGRLSPDRTGAVARLLVRGERRSPGAFLQTCEPDVLDALAAAVVGSEAAFGLFAGYAAWDGAEPAPTDLGVDHGGARVTGTQPDPAAQGKAFAQTHHGALQPWGGGGG